MADYFYAFERLVKWGWFERYFDGRDELLQDVANENNQ